MRIQNILFPVDFSPSCVAMAPFAKKGAAMLSAKVTLLHVLELSSSGFELLAWPPPEVEENHKKAARAKLDSFLDLEFPRQESTRLLVVGDAAARIAEVAREGRFDMIVMPTHAGVFRRMLLGSTTAKVLADSERVVRVASQLAQTVHAKLTLLHAIPACPFNLTSKERVQSEERKAAFRRIEELQAAVGSHARAIIAVGPLKDTLTEVARRLRADVLMIGRSPLAGVRLRDLTYAVVRDAPCPVLSV